MTRLDTIKLHQRYSTQQKNAALKKPLLLLCKIVSAAVIGWLLLTQQHSYTTNMFQLWLAWHRTQDEMYLLVFFSRLFVACFFTFTCISIILFSFNAVKNKRQYKAIAKERNERDVFISCYFTFYSSFFFFILNSQHVKLMKITLSTYTTHRDIPKMNCVK